MTDTQAAAEAPVPTETISGPGGGRSRRRLWLFGGAVVAVAAVAVGSVLLFGGGDEQGLKQTLCGLERADGTPLGTLLPKGRPGTEQREVVAGQVSCRISVDGEEALSVSLLGVDPEGPEEAGHATTKDLIGRGVLASGPGAGVTEYCAGDHSRAFIVSVIADTGMFFKSNADRDALTKALGSLTGKVAAEQQHEVCR